MSEGIEVVGHLVEVEWEGRAVDAFLPAPLAAMELRDPGALRATALAEGALTALGHRESTGLEVPARLLLRAEGLASSRIEAVDAAVDAVAVAAAGVDVDGPASWVAGNLRAVDASLGHTGPLTVEDLFAWHRLVMAGSSLESDHVGAWRDRLGWIGGPTPFRAAHVAAPQERIEELMADLVRYLNGRAHDAVAQAAIGHAQFEVIHPFADGNGRIGRILIGWVLRRRLGLAVPPPVSVALARDIGGYLSGLTLFRLEPPDRWVRWFAGAVEGAAMTADRTLAALAAVQLTWPQRLADIRSDAAAHRLVDVLAEHPAIDVASAARLLGSTETSARTAIGQLVARGILREVTGLQRHDRGRPRRWWAAGELLDLLVR